MQKYQDESARQSTDNVQNKETAQALRYKYKSESQYFPLWLKVKQQGKITVEVTDERSYKKIVAGVGKMKKQDYHFKVSCELELGYHLQLVFEPNEKAGSMVIKLKDTENQLNEINFL
jgi:hypothetical protein